MKSKKDKKKKDRTGAVGTDQVASALSAMGGPLDHTDLIRLIFWATVASGLSRDWEMISSEVDGLMDGINRKLDEMKSGLH